MARKRDYRREYQRRIAPGRALGLSRSEARGHPRPGKDKRRPPKPVQSTPHIEAAIRDLRDGESLTRVAKRHGVPRERFRRFIHQESIAHREGRSWVMTDKRPRRVMTITQGRERVVVVRDFEEASRWGRYVYDVGEFLRTNEPELLTPHRGRGVWTNDGRFIAFETSPNALHRLASAGLPVFHEVYEIVQS